jgi:hypothetical protein
VSYEEEDTCMSYVEDTSANDCNDKKLDDDTANS